MSNYLYNILARSFGLIETAQPLVTSLFEPPRDFKPVDALQISARMEESAPASKPPDESAPTVSSVNKQGEAPAQMAQKAVYNSSSSMEASIVLPEPESRTAPLTGEKPPRLSSLENAHEKADAPSPVAPRAQSQSVRPSAVFTEPSLQREAPPEREAPPAAKSPAHASPKNEAPAETKFFVNEPTRPLELIAQREPSAQRRVFEHSLATDKRPHSLSQGRDAAAPGKLSQKAMESSSPSVEINNITHQRSETLVVQTQGARYVETKPTESQQPARAPEAEQVVQVTIGRIEVRAAQAPPARQGTQPRSAPQPSQSLEEYLRQRARGGGNR